MKVICSYCSKEIGEKKPLDDGSVSHSICKDCHEYYSKQITGMSFDEYLDRFDVPVFIVDDEVRILAANEMAETMLGKPMKDFVGLLGGEALECVYARLPEGCGNTIHCVTCAIRITVTSTIQDGVLHKDVPSKLHLEDDEIALYLSTETIGSCVCVKIKMAETT